MPADIQARIRRKEEGASPTRKKVKSAPVVDDDEVTEVPAPAGPRTPEKPRADKGKGKEKEVPVFGAASPTAETPGVGDEGEGDDHQGKVGKKWKNNYKHLIKNIPGAFCVRLFSGSSG